MKDVLGLPRLVFGMMTLIMILLFATSAYGWYRLMELRPGTIDRTEQWLRIPITPTPATSKKMPPAGAEKKRH